MMIFYSKYRSSSEYTLYSSRSSIKKCKIYQNCTCPCGSLYRSGTMWLVQSRCSHVKFIMQCCTSFLVTCLMWLTRNVFAMTQFHHWLFSFVTKLIGHCTCICYQQRRESLQYFDKSLQLSPLQVIVIFYTVTFYSALYMPFTVFNIMLE